MKTKQTTNLTNYVNVFTIFAFVIFTIFQFLQSSDFEKLIMIDFRMIFAGGIYCIIGIWLFTRISTIPLGILAMAAGGFLLYAYFYYFNFGSFALENASPYRIVLAFIATISVVAGVNLFVRNKKDSTDRMASNFLLTISIVVIVLIIGDYILPKPMRISVETIMFTAFFVFIPIALSFGANAFWYINTIPSKIVGSLYRILFFLSLPILIISMNNVLYSGCWPSYPVGCKCGFVSEISLPISESEAPEVSVVPPVGHTVSNTIFIPKGGSLCGTLGMTGDEALHFAKENGLKYWWKKGMLYVLIFPGDQFHKVDGKWELM